MACQWVQLECMSKDYIWYIPNLPTHGQPQKGRNNSPLRGPVVCSFYYLGCPCYHVMSWYCVPPLLKLTNNWLCRLLISSYASSNTNVQWIARHPYYRIAGNFRGRKVSRIDEIQDFAEKTFTDATVKTTDRIQYRVSHAHNRLL